MNQFAFKKKYMEIKVLVTGKAKIGMMNLTYNIC